MLRKLVADSKTVSMSLIVNTYKRLPAGGMDIIEVAHAEEVAGFERCRHDLWGHEFVLSLGLALLPSLVHTDIHAEGEALDLLEREAGQIIVHVAGIAEATQYRADYITSRCQNILAAVRRAREIGGGVVIW